jgi:hypothetical protein
MRALGLTFFFFAIAAGCGGKIDGGIDGGIDSGVDSPSCKPASSACSASAECCSGDCLGGVCSSMPPTCSPDYAKCGSSAECCSGICDPQMGYCQPGGPPPPCEPDGMSCGSASDCCSAICSSGYCGGVPPPGCNPDGASCQVPYDCCSGVCSNHVCGGIVIDGGVSCASTSNKQCDQCVATYCCQQMVSCGNDATCSNWLSCVQGCEQKGYSAFTCSQYNYCGGPSSTTETALYSCAKQYCPSQCQTD